MPVRFWAMTFSSSVWRGPNHSGPSKVKLFYLLESLPCLDFPSVRELYSDASQILGYDLLKLCLEGPKSLLDETKYCQVPLIL
jgi:hypothetical protein